MRKIVALVLPGLLALAFSSCSDDSTPVKSDTRARADKGAKVDTGASPDGGTQPDGAPLDRGQQPDHGKKPDGAALDGPRGDLKKLDAGTIYDIAKGDAPRPDGLPPLPSNAVCASPMPLTLGVPVTADTSPSADQFPGVDCGNGAGPWGGAQLYYKVTLTAGKKYKAAIAPSFDAALYAFPAGTACDETAINAACTNPSPADPNNIYNSDGLGNEIVRIAPATTGDWIIVVDSWSPAESGSFTLTVSEVNVPPNQICGHTLPLTVGTPVTGDSSDAVDEFGTISCGNSYGPWTGGQLYYRVTLSAGKRYEATVDGGFDAALYAFPATTACDATAINTACTVGSDPYNVLNADRAISGPESIWIAPASDGDWIIVVDGAQSGTFTLTVSEFTPPTNGVCASPEPVTLGTSPVTISADSSTPPVANEFGTSITCNSGYDFDGKQLYYKLPLQAGTTYTIVVTPVGWDVAIYAFTDATCDPTTIDTQCAANVKDDGFTGDPETLVITPTAATDYILAIDSYATDGGGAFTMTITW